MQHHETGIVVGADGSPGSLSAVEWAAADAGRRQRPLRIVHAYPWPPVYPPLDAPLASYEDVMQKAAGAVVAAAAAHALAVSPDLRVDKDIRAHQPAAALIDASHHAALVVLGNRGLGGFSGLLLGSVGVQVAAHAACPVVIVRQAAGDAGPYAGRVLVGIDGSHDAGHALRLAFEQASFRQVGLTAVHAYRWPAATDPGDMLPLVYDDDDLREDERRVVIEAMTGWAEQYPDVDVRSVVVRGSAGRVLAEASAGAELLVVGSRGRGGFTGLLLGSVSQAAIHHAACPVAVVR